MKQKDLFGNDIIERNDDDRYTKKIKAPVYEPRGVKPHVLELCDSSKVDRMIAQIKSSNISEEEKRFLIKAAQRHLIFNYSKIADYYAQASPEMQQLMERSALVIIDFEDAIQYGYVKLSDQITEQYLSEYEEE